MKTVEEEKKLQKELLGFLEEKAREEGGGGFWQVLKHGREVGTVWARNEKDAVQFLVDTQERNKQRFFSTESTKTNQGTWRLPASDGWRKKRRLEKK